MADKKQQPIITPILCQEWIQRFTAAAHAEEKIAGQLLWIRPDLIVVDDIPNIQQSIRDFTETRQQLTEMLLDAISRLTRHGARQHKLRRARRKAKRLRRVGFWSRLIWVLFGGGRCAKTFRRIL
jgi:hypothetical protein